MTRRRGLPSAPLVEDDDLRARNIKPGFFENEELAELGPEAMLLFAGLWCHVDREGRCEDRPKRIKAKVFPYFDVDVNGLLQQLHERGFIVRYEVDESAYIQVKTFSVHQNPHPRESPSVIPAEKRHAQGEPKANQGVVEPGGISESPISDSLIADSLTPESDAPPVRARAEYRPDFEAWWKRYPTGFGNKKQAAKQWDAMSVEERRSAEDGLGKWLRSDRWQRKFVKAAEIWLRDRWWENDPPDPPRPEANGRAPTMSDEFAVLRQQMSGSSGQSIEAAWRER